MRLLLKHSTATYMTHRFLTSAAVFLALALTSCGPKVDVQTATLSDLSRFKTYAWYPGEGEIVGVYDARGQLAAEVIRESVNDAMKRKGFRPDADGDADLLVFYRLGVKSRREIDEYATVQRGGETVAVPDEVTIYRGGTLLIYLLDRRTTQVVWAGTASAEAKANDSEAAMRSRLESAVRAVFDGMKMQKKS